MDKILIDKNITDKNKNITDKFQKWIPLFPQLPLRLPMQRCLQYSPLPPQYNCTSTDNRVTGPHGVEVLQ